MPPTKTKVLLDTDIDILGDIDDVMCLAYLLAQPACDLLGITTVSWDTTRRAMVASALCKAAGRAVPIFPGAETPLLARLPTFESQPGDPEGAALAGWEHDTTFPRGQAIEFMRQTIRKHPGEVVLLAIGPLTNIALLFAADPEIPRLLNGLVMMAGLFTRAIPAAGPREWNALLDPHATAMVYRAGVAAHRSVGLDVTFDMRLDAAEVRQRLQGHHLALLRYMTEAWFRKAPSVIFHDPLAAATIFDDRLCRFARGQVEVELDDEQLRGATRWAPGAPSSPHEIAVEVDHARFFEHYFSILARAPTK
jgi:inosine-uridine nucleoside N-ribohydrolase